MLKRSGQLPNPRVVETRSAEGVDGYAPDGRTVQVKATGTGRGPAFRCTEICADHLRFFDLDIERLAIAVLFNGPEALGTKVASSAVCQSAIVIAQSDTRCRSSGA
jgi:hypothetical protein